MWKNVHHQFIGILSNLLFLKQNKICKYLNSSFHKFTQYWSSWRSVLVVQVCPMPRSKNTTNFRQIKHSKHFKNQILMVKYRVHFWNKFFSLLTEIWSSIRYPHIRGKNISVFWASSPCTSCALKFADGFVCFWKSVSRGSICSSCRTDVFSGRSS